MELSITYFLAYYFIRKEILSQELANYFSCQASVMWPQDDCRGLSLTEHVVWFQGLLTASTVMVALVPTVTLLLNVELKIRGNCCCSCRKTRHQT